MKEGKIRKFDDTQRTDNQTVQRLRPLYPLWILEGVGQQYSTVQYCTVHYNGNKWQPTLLASSLKYPQRIEWTQLLKRSLLDCSLIVSKFSHFSLFHPSLFIQYSTEECSTVQLFIGQLPRVSREDQSGVSAIIIKQYGDRKNSSGF